MTDPNRPTYHYSSGGWMNDVIPFAEGDRLHVMFNHHKEARFGRFRWGHAHTDDLLAGWEDQFTFWPRLEEWVLVPLRAGYRLHAVIERDHIDKLAKMILATGWIVLYSYIVETFAAWYSGLKASA